jgi:MoxR-like ATPase
MQPQRHLETKNTDRNHILFFMSSCLRGCLLLLLFVSWCLGGCLFLSYLLFLVSLCLGGCLFLSYLLFLVSPCLGGCLFLSSSLLCAFVVPPLSFGMEGYLIPILLSANEAQWLTKHSTVAQFPEETMTDYGKPGFDPQQPADFKAAFAAEKYLLPDNAATVLFLAGALDKPVLVEGPAGVGKTDCARVLARVLDRKLIRLQCYEGLDEAKALYEWQYGKQLLYGQILREKIAEVTSGAAGLSEAMDRVFAFEDLFFSQRFLQPRPLLEAILSEDPVVLLVDEVDKSDPEFEAFLLEVLSDFTVSIPELGTMSARTIPRVILTSNNGREMSDALKRRCLHLFLDFPSPETELEIIRYKVPDLDESLAKQAVNVVEKLRNMPLKKTPGISETLDWASSLVTLCVDNLSDEVLNQTMTVLLKYERDLDQAREKLKELRSAMG